MGALSRKAGFQHDQIRVWIRLAEASTEVIRLVPAGGATHENQFGSMLFLGRADLPSWDE
jgi:hypothetical protein